MEYTTDIAINSSINGFIVSHNNYFTEEQRNHLADFALKNFLGAVTCSTEKELAEYFNNTHGCSYTVGMFSKRDGSLINIEKLKIAVSSNNFILALPSLKAVYAPKILPYLHLYLNCLREIKNGNSVSFGCIDNSIPAGELQKDFWDALSGDNFKVLSEDKEGVSNGFN